MPAKSKKRFPPYLGDDDHCYVVVDVSGGVPGRVAVFPQIEPLIYTRDELRREVTEGTYTPAWSWREVERVVKRRAVTKQKKARAR